MGVLPELIGVIESGDHLGECPVWNEVDRRIWWTDIHGCRLLRADPEHGVAEVVVVPERVASFAFIAGEERRILAAFGSGLGVLDLASGDVAWISRLEEPGSGRRLNDGRVDRHGRFWVASMVEDARAEAGSAGLYCLGREGVVRRMAGDVEIGNGLCVAPDAGTLYFADSARQVVHAFDLDLGGEISGRRVFASVSEGAPDGAAVDAEGCVWSARWGAGCVVRHAPDGAVMEVLGVPVSQPSCVAFGGADGRLMFVTSAREGLDAAALAREPLAGSLLIYRSAVAGLPARRYDGAWMTP